MTRILVVEDEDCLREMIVEVIRAEGFEIVEASSADAAIGLLDLEGLGLVVTDINMPGRLDGIDLAFAARAAHPGIPVIFMSGRAAKLEEAGSVTHPVGFLAKPFSFSRLVENIQRLA